MSKSRDIPGAQTAQRTLKLLKLLGAHHAHGMTAPQIVEAMGEERSAIQRALRALEAENLVQRCVDGHRYQLGLEAMHIGLATLQQAPLVEAYRFAVQRVAHFTGDTVFLSVRVGDFVLCVLRDEGSSHVRAPRTRVGELRVLGTTAGGLALLSRLSDEEVRRIYDLHVADFDRARMDFLKLRQHVSQTRSRGYAVLSDNVSEGVTSLGMCFGSPSGQSSAAVAIAAAQPRMKADRLPALIDLLQGMEPAALRLARPWNAMGDNAEDRPTGTASAAG